LCAGYKAFFQHVAPPMNHMVTLLQQQRPPAEIMALYAQQDREREALFAQTKRNEPCPCGSGKKFKQCHGKKR
jgi:uncharacterized protein